MTDNIIVKVFSNQPTTKECPHSDIFEGACVGCGMMYNQIVNTGTRRDVRSSKPANKSIVTDLEKLGFNEAVRNKANQIYLQMHCNIKKGKKEQLLFYCVFYACFELGIKEDPVSIAEKIGLNQESIQDALTGFSQQTNQYNPPNTLHTALDFLPSFCRKLDLSDEDHKSLEALTIRLLARSQDLIEENPRKVAGGIIQYYLEINGVKYNKKQLAIVFCLSDVTITNVYRKIAALDNS